MDNQFYPGESVARQYGYVLHSHNGNHTEATYHKDGIFLVALRNGEFRFEKVLGLVMCSLGPFSMPNKNFAMFESQIKNIEFVTMEK